jgi:hypothetical protein
MHILWSEKYFLWKIKVKNVVNIILSLYFRKQQFLFFVII